MSGSQIALHLARELELLETTLVAAERAAIGCRRTRIAPSVEPDSDLASRRAELDRREQALDRRERALESRCKLQDQAQEKLARTSGSLKRAIRRFRSHEAKRLAVLDEREQRLATHHTELIRDRREMTREQMRLKAQLR